MNCAEVKLVLVDLLYGELSTAGSAAARKHLAACDACRREFAGLEKCRRQLGRVTEQPVRVDLARLCLRGAEQWQRSRRRWRRIGYATVAALILMGALVSRQVRWEFQEGQMLIVWRNALPHEARPNGPPLPDPVAQAPAEHLAAADYLRLRTQALNEGVDATAKTEPRGEEPAEAPRSYRSLRNQLLNPPPEGKS